MFEAVRHRRVLSIMPTYQCTASCADCGTFSTPSPRQPRLDRTLFFRAIDQAAEAGYTGIVFTGGEATLVLDMLIEGVAHAKRLGLPTRLVTNAHWAETDAQADDVVRRLAEAGLTEINFSTGDEHARFIPVENIVRAVVASVRHSIRGICVMVEVRADTEVTADQIALHPAYVSALKGHASGRVRILPSPWMPMSGNRTHAYPDAILLSRANVDARPGCTSCLTTTTLQADGRIAACCGLGMRGIPELQIGHIATTSLSDADQEAESDFLKRWLRLEGPEQILAWAGGKDDSIRWENMYAHKCQACLRLYKDPKVRAVIREHYEEKIPDIVFGEFLMSHFEPDRSSSSGLPDDIF